jgi:hypothetical protein
MAISGMGAAWRVQAGAPGAWHAMAGRGSAARGPLVRVQLVQSIPQLYEATHFIWGAWLEPPDARKERKICDVTCGGRDAGGR